MAVDLSRYDLWELGVDEVMRNMAEDAGVTDPIEMGWDFPANGVLSRSDEYSSDLHVEIGNYDDEWDVFNVGFENEDEPATLSMYEALAPATIAKEPGPSDTTPPFEHLHGESGLPGLFGEALKSYGEAVCICVVMNTDPTPIHEAFANSWGLTPDEAEYARTLVPTPRSTGDAFWGGISANLNPACFAMPASQVGLKVKFHNKNRYSMGSNKLVDWARMKAVAQSVTIQVVSDDAVARNKVKRLDYRIDTREIPNAPKLLKLPKVNVPVATYATEVRVASETIQYLRRGGMKPIREPKYIAGDTITVSQDLEVPMSIGNYMDIEVRAPVLAYGNLMEAEDDNMDIVIRPRAPNLTTTNRKKVQAKDILKAIAESQLQHGHLPDMRSFGIRRLIVDSEMESGEDSQRAFRQLRQAVHDVFPPSVAINVVSMGNLLTKDGGRKYLANIARSMKAHRGIMQEHNIRNIWSAVTNDRGSINMLAEVIATALAKMDRIHEPKITKSIRSLFVCTGELEGPLNEVFAMRKRYWSNRYYRSSRSTDDQDRKIRWQQLAKIFKGAKFVIESNGVVRRDDSEIVVLFQDSISKYIRKRLGVGDKDYTSPVMEVAVIQRGEADRLCMKETDDEPNPTFASIAHKLDEGLTEFQNDVKDFMRKAILQEPELMEADPDEYSEFKEEVMEHPYKKSVDPFINYAEDLDDAMFFAQDSVKKGEINASFLDDDAWDVSFQDSIAEVNDDFMNAPVTRVPMLSLADELRDDVRGITADIIEKFVREHGSLVAVGDYDAIMNAARSAFILSTTVQVDGFDIE